LVATILSDCLEPKDVNRHIDFLQKPKEEGAMSFSQEVTIKPRNGNQEERRCVIEMDHQNIYEVDTKDNNRVSKKMPLINLDVIRIIDDASDVGESEPTCILEFTFIDEVMLTVQVDSYQH
jgi:hypothetical protein